jgi:uncharacterized membrane protein YuzA (DUF378 family)
MFRGRRFATVYVLVFVVVGAVTYGLLGLSYQVAFAITAITASVAGAAAAGRD